MLRSWFALRISLGFEPIFHLFLIFKEKANFLKNFALELFSIFRNPQPIVEKLRDKIFEIQVVSVSWY